MCSQCPDFGRIIGVLLNDGVDALSEKCQMLPGTPLKPMLAHPTKGVQEVLQRFDGIKFTCEFKYDGERAQVSVEFLIFIQKKYKSQNYLSKDSHKRRWNC